MQKSSKFFTLRRRSGQALESVTEGYRDLLAVRLRNRNVLAVYGFGSFFRGTATRHSDIDFGILFAPGRRGPTTLQIRRVRDVLTEVFGQERVDLVMLNTAGPLIRYEAVTCGRLLYVRRGFHASLYETRVLKEYEDTRHLRLSAGERMLRRIALGTFGQPAVERL